MGKWWFNQQTYTTYTNLGFHELGFNQLYLGANSSGACKHHSSPGWLKLYNKRSVLASTVDVCRIFHQTNKWFQRDLQCAPSFRSFLSPIFSTDISTFNPGRTLWDHHWVSCDQNFGHCSHMISINGSFSAKCNLETISLPVLG